MDTQDNQNILISFQVFRSTGFIRKWIKSLCTVDGNAKYFTTYLHTIKYKQRNTIICKKYILFRIKITT